MSICSRCSRHRQPNNHVLNALRDLGLGFASYFFKSRLKPISVSARQQGGSLPLITWILTSHPQ